jgi:4-hydroxy-tetrahydrodipicolinate synthase
MPRPLHWRGVLPALTTPFTAELAVDHVQLARDVERLLEAGCSGIVALGSLGEAPALDGDEKLAILRTCVAAAGDAPVVAGVSALATREATALARAAADAGASGLMVLPPYVHSGDPRETVAHFAAVFAATALPCMLYNNPPAYRTDVTPELVVALADEHPNLLAVKESSGDVRRITAINALAGDRLDVLVGIDDSLLEGMCAGASGWIAGLANVLPRESVELFELAAGGPAREARDLYEWFLPLLRFDVGPKFVQKIKLAQATFGNGSERVRPPRLVLTGDEREAALAVIREAVSAHP